MLMKFVFVCSRYSGDVATNVARTKDYCRRMLAEGDAPLAPHLLFPQILDDNDPADRQLGLWCSQRLLAACEEVHVFAPDRCISEGMQAEVELAIQLGRPIVWHMGEAACGRG